MSVVLTGDFNGHESKHAEGYKGVHGYRVRDAGETILECDNALSIINSYTTPCLLREIADL